MHCFCFRYIKLECNAKIKFMAINIEACRTTLEGGDHEDQKVVHERIANLLPPMSKPTTGHRTQIRNVQQSKYLHLYQLLRLTTPLTFSTMPTVTWRFVSIYMAVSVSRISRI